MTWEWALAGDTTATCETMRKAIFNLFIHNLGKLCNYVVLFWWRPAANPAFTTATCSLKEWSSHNLWDFFRGLIEKRLLTRTDHHQTWL
jgi:hypothetical protein